MAKPNENESLGSRLGFLLLAAGCAIGLGNVWRFPYVTGKYGGAFFFLFYLLFLIILGFPCMVVELAIGRGGRASLDDCYRKLAGENKKFGWHRMAAVAFSGNLILLMFYSVVTGWLLNYTAKYILGTIQPTADGFGPVFGDMLSNPGMMIFWTAIGIILTTIVCAFHIQKGLERVTKFLMVGLLMIMLGLVGVALSSGGGLEGLKFFLMPNLESVKANGLGVVIYEAMNQSFFTLSIGIGSLAIFGSYMSEEKTLAQESVIIIALDTLVAVCSGLIIFPCCFAHNVNPGAGPSLIFITLPEVFSQMNHGRLWGIAFFFFISAAALTTLIAVAENLIAFCIHKFNMKRYKASILIGIVLLVTSLPCIFGFNVWSAFKPFGGDSCVLDLEDFIVSNNLLPMGALLSMLFVSYSKGWGMDKFLAEANTGNGLKFTRVMAYYCKYLLPFVILTIWALGLYYKFCAK